MFGLSGCREENKKSAVNKPVSFLSHFSLKLLNLHSCSGEIGASPSRFTPPGTFLKINNNKHPTKEILNNEFTQKPRTTSSKGKHLLSPSVAGTWEGALCVGTRERGNHGFWRRQCDHLNKKWNLSPTVCFIPQFPLRVMKQTQKKGQQN